MPKGYWLPQIDVSNPEGYQAYMAATPPAHEKYHGIALARGGKSELVEGHVRSRTVIREFPDYATALACYRSDEYQRARPLRLPHSHAIFSSSRAMTARSQRLRVRRPPPAARKGYWIGHVDVTDPEGYKPIWSPTWCRSANLAAVSWSAAARAKSSEGKVRSVPW